MVLPVILMTSPCMNPNHPCNKKKWIVQLFGHAKKVQPPLGLPDAYNQQLLLLGIFFFFFWAWIWWWLHTQLLWIFLPFGKKLRKVIPLCTNLISSYTKSSEHKILSVSIKMLLPGCSVWNCLYIGTIQVKTVARRQQSTGSSKSHNSNWWQKRGNN